MGKKKKGGESHSADEPGYNPEALADNYKKVCQKLGLKLDDGVAENFKDPSESAEGCKRTWPPTQVNCDSDLNPAGMRAVCLAILGPGELVGESAGPYKLMQSLSFWRNNGRDEGAAAVAELLRQGKDSVPITHVQLMDNKVGIAGCAALGSALQASCNKKLITLRLNLNDTINDAACAALCEGMCNNASLKKLDLEQCSIGADGALALGKVLSYQSSAMETLNLRGNRIGNAGLQALSRALAKNKKLKAIDIRDNMCGIAEGGLQAACEALRNAMRDSPTLERVDFTDNRISAPGEPYARIFEDLLWEKGTMNEETGQEEGGKAALPKIKHFTMDTNVGTQPTGTADERLILTRVIRIGDDGGGKKKGKKKKSDARLKTNTLPLGKSARGVPLWAFEYAADSQPRKRHLGVMAQQLLAMGGEAANAVHTSSDGWYEVDYARLGMGDL